jgi:DNA-directed RNA polymerase specialized sigma24 family protein
MCRYIRSFRADCDAAEEIAQRALIKLFSHLGPHRREADRRIRGAIEALRPLALGRLHLHQVEHWRREVTSVVDALINFSSSHTSLPGWKELRDDTNGRIQPLVQQGFRFLDEVRVHVALCVHTLGSAELTDPQDEPPSNASAGDDLEIKGAKRFAATLLAAARIETDVAAERTLGCPGAVSFVRSTNTVCADLPYLSIPSNGLLYTIARRQFLDTVRAARTEARRRVEFPLLAEAAEPLDEMNLEPDGPGTGSPLDADALLGDSDPDHAGEFADAAGEIGAKYQAFLEFLRAPLTRAEGALAEALFRGKARAEQARVESLRAKHDRMMSILHALHESPQPSEEEIGLRLCLTRNQVKYAIERIRDEFGHFFPSLSGDAQGRRKRPGAES